MTEKFGPLILGTQVRFTHYLIRRGPYPNRRWEPVSVSGAKDYSAPPLCYQPSTVGNEYIEGIVVGARTLANGQSHWDGDVYEGGSWEWRHRESVPVYLIAWHLRRAVARVLTEHLELR